MGNGKKALVEFVSANPTGPMHIGNASLFHQFDHLAQIHYRMLRYIFIFEDVQYIQSWVVVCSAMVSPNCSRR